VPPSGGGGGGGGGGGAAAGGAAYVDSPPMAALLSRLAQDMLLERAPCVVAPPAPCPLVSGLRDSLLNRRVSTSEELRHRRISS